MLNREINAALADVATKPMGLSDLNRQPDGVLYGGAYCQVEFELPANPGTLRLPSTALIPTDKGTEVALLGTDSKAQLKPIQLGRDFGDSVEVVAGLEKTRPRHRQST